MLCGRNPVPAHSQFANLIIMVQPAVFFNSILQQSRKNFFGDLPGNIIGC